MNLKMQKFKLIIHFLLLPVLLPALLASCSQSKAPVVNRGSVFYGRGSFKGHKNSANKTKSSKALSSTIVTVDGDTVYSLAKKHNVALRDLINSNNLTPPYVLKAGTKLNLPSNQYHLVVAGDTLYSISRQYGMNVSNLIATNNIKAPYSVRIGEMLNVSNSATSPTSSVAYGQKNDNQKSNTAIKESLPEMTIVDKNNHFSWPIKGAIISKFGAKPGGLYNDGINISAKSGDNVKAAEDGVVAYAGDELRGYGNLLIIKHSGGWISAYAHLDKTKVKRGVIVKKGQNIATIGSTGNVKIPQLYFGLRKGREAVNPQIYL